MNELLKETSQLAESLGLYIETPADGFIDSELAIIGQSPCKTEVELGKPLVGSSGRYLFNRLKEIGLGRGDFFITNAVKRFVSPKETMSPNEKEKWSTILQNELVKLPNIKYVMLLGNLALEAMTGEEKIGDWRGSPIKFKLKDGREVKGIALNNPASILKEAKLDPIFRMDTAKFDKLISGVIKDDPVIGHFNLTPNEACQAIIKLMDEKKRIAFDIETMANETACVGFANSIREATCINFRGPEGYRWTINDEKKVRILITKLLGDNSTELVAQNGAFDCGWLWFKDRIRVKSLHLDTLLAHHTLYPTLPHNLGFLTTQYTDHPYYKDDGKNWKEDQNYDQFWQYNCVDCAITLEVAGKLEAALKQQHMDRFFFDHVMKIQPHLIWMTVCGIKADTELKDNLAIELRAEVEKLRLQFVEEAKIALKLPPDDPFRPNPRSSTQLKKLLFDDLKLIGRGTSTDEDNRIYMIAHPRTNEAAQQMLKTLNQYKKEDKFLNTYVESEIDDDGRIRCEYKQYGVQSAPGRLSSAQTLWKSGMNLQNQPDRAQEMFITDNGYEFSYFDLAQAEARVVGWKAKIDKWKEQFEHARIHGDYDAHRALCADMYGIPYEDTPKTDFEDGKHTLRYVAKRCRHGLNYMMEVDTLAQQAGLNKLEAIDAYRKYHNETPELKRWWARVEREIRDKKCLFNPYGRRFLLMTKYDRNEMLRTLVAYYPQSTIGDKVSRVIRQCHEDDKWPIHARIVLNVHDALIAINREKDGPLVRGIMKKYAEEPIMIEGEPLIIPADFKVSYTTEEDSVHRWGRLKKCSLDQIKVL